MVYAPRGLCFKSPSPRNSISRPVNANTSGWAATKEHFLLESPSVTFGKPLGLYALEQQRGSPRGPAAHHRSMAVIREGNYTHNLFNGPQVQQRREAHKDPDQGGLLLHRREQEVQEHISEFPPPPHSPPPQSLINQECTFPCSQKSRVLQRRGTAEFRGKVYQLSADQMISRHWF